MNEDISDLLRQQVITNDKLDALIENTDTVNKNLGVFMSTVIALQLLHLDHLGVNHEIVDATLDGVRDIFKERQAQK